MQRYIYLIIVLTAFIAGLAEAQTYYSHDAKTGTTVSSSPGGFFMADRNGNVTIVTSPNADAISGSWSRGINVDFSRVLQGIGVPPIMNLTGFQVTLDNGTNLDVVASTPQEGSNKQAQNEAIIKRANLICQMTNTHPYVHHVDTGSQWFSNTLLDITQSDQQGNYRVFKQVHVGGFSGARYFKKIVCGVRPYGAQ